MVFYYIINCLGAEVFLSTEDIHTRRRKKGAIKHRRMMIVLHDENFASESQAAGISIVLSSPGSIGMQTADASPSCLLFDAGILFWEGGGFGRWGEPFSVS